MPSIAVVIPAHNEERTLPAVLDGLARQERAGPALDVVVVSDASRDRTEAIAREFAARHPWVRVLVNEHNLGLAGTLRRGIAETKGEVVVTMHADIVPHHDDWLARIGREFEDPKVGAVGSLIHSKVAGLPLVDRFFLEAPPRVMLGNKSDAYRRDLLDRLGGFDASFRVAGEDVDLDHRIREAGFDVRFPNGLDVDHLMGWHQMGLRKHVKKEVQYAEVQPRLYRRHGYMTTALYGITLPLLALNAIALLAERSIAPALWAVNGALLALALFLDRKHRLLQTGLFATGYLALGAIATSALGRDVARAPSTAVLLGVAIAFALWNAARTVTKTARLRDPLVPLLAFPLFVLQDVARGWGFLKGARGFLEARDEG